VIQPKHINIRSTIILERYNKSYQFSVEPYYIVAATNSTATQTTPKMNQAKVLPTTKLIDRNVKLFRHRNVVVVVVALPYRRLPINCMSLTTIIHMMIMLVQLQTILFLNQVLYIPQVDSFIITTTTTQSVKSIETQLQKQQQQQSSLSLSTNAYNDVPRLHHSRVTQYQQYQKQQQQLKQGKSGRLTCLQESTDSSSTTRSNSNSNTNNVRFLGKGESAIVRPGVVLLAPKDEYHHFYRNAAIFIFAMGEDDNDEYVIRGVIIDHPTPFTLSEMMEGEITNQASNNPLRDNLIFRGGDTGGEGVIVLHNQNNIGYQHEIGTSGIYQGGWDDAVQACANGRANASDFKVFFNYCEFTEAQIESLLQTDYNEESGGDAWCAVEVDNQIILREEFDRGDGWSLLRNAVAPYLTNKR
jgi:putative AlgH/UPF0301 family transcriptional regulator